MGDAPRREHDHLRHRPAKPTRHGFSLWKRCTVAEKFLTLAPHAVWPSGVLLDVHTLTDRFISQAGFVCGR